MDLNDGKRCTRFSWESIESISGLQVKSHMISATPEYTAGSRMCFELAKCMLTATEMHPKQARSQGQRIFYAHACTPKPIPNTLCIANFDQLGSPQKDTCKRL